MPLKRRRWLRGTRAPEPPHLGPAGSVICDPCTWLRQKERWVIRQALRVHTVPPPDCGITASRKGHALMRRPGCSNTPSPAPAPYPRVQAHMPSRQQPRAPQLSRWLLFYWGGRIAASMTNKTASYCGREQGRWNPKGQVSIQSPTTAPVISSQPLHGFTSGSHSVSIYEMEMSVGVTFQVDCEISMGNTWHHSIKNHP